MAVNADIFWCSYASLIQLTRPMLKCKASFATQTLQLSSQMARV